ncbi:DUF2189 domain-containing protein [Pseudothioclava arenosa]|uniref:DUF2189 domain-containing protein n=1 Tax=Pseudothioclava arenosa TaxID=1795308 RepID=A0A2A4CU36_9RHOB|nr:DUF2189 domain-containing protein [Pseudothioclava arenosa]PCD77659.1 hypothetical protein CLN94_03940 [Pseudothioclava arenosa]
MDDVIERPSEPSAIPEVKDMKVGTIRAVLEAGWQDFRRAPAFGLFFSGFYVLGGLVLWGVFAARGEEWWLMPFILGFPLLAPFAAIGLYEVSRRLEAGESLVWREIIGCCIAQKDRQIPSIAVVILLLFMFWIFIAHTSFALFLGTKAFSGNTSPVDVLLSANGLAMLAFGSAVGGAFAAVLFSFTVVGLPLLLERDIDFITAIITSFKAVAANPASMAIWAAVISGLLFLGMLPGFLGLFIVLPVLGHASWHMYRQLTK